MENILPNSCCFADIMTKICQAFLMIPLVLYILHSPFHSNVDVIIIHSFDDNKFTIVPKKEMTYKFGMPEDDSTYIYVEDVSQSAKPSTPVTKGTLQMSNMSTPVMKPSAKWQRKIKPLPESIADMTSADSHHLVMSEELNPIARARHMGNH